MTVAHDRAAGRAGRRVMALLCAAALAGSAIGGCADQPLGPRDDAGPSPALRGIAIALRVDLIAGSVTSVSRASTRSSATGRDGPSLALLGSNELGVATSNFFRSATGAFTPRKQRVRFDVALTNTLAGAAFVTPTFPQPPLGATSLLLFPFQISQIIGGGSVAPSTDWDGDGSAGSGAPYNFFNDYGCPKGTQNDCYRWEGYPSPLNPGATSAPRTVGFDVDPSVQSFVVYVVLAADLEDASSPLPAGSGKIAFVSDRDGNGEIYVMNEDGTLQANLTANPANDYGPAWSPDGSKIAFTSNRDGNQEIYVMNADGTNPTRLTNDPATDVEPAWSPDGSKIAVASNRDAGNYDIYVMNADGTNPTRLTNNAAFDHSPAWSPDGSKIAFESRRDGNDEIYVMNADGTLQTNLTSVLADDRKPHWSPDGSRIAFASARIDGLFFHIHVMNADGTSVTNLTTGLFDDFEPAWSSDGSKIAFASFRDGKGEIYVMQANGTLQANATRSPLSEETSPAWKP